MTKCLFNNDTKRCRKNSNNARISKRCKYFKQTNRCRKTTLKTQKQKKQNKPAKQTELQKIDESNAYFVGDRKLIKLTFHKTNKSHPHSFVMRDIPSNLNSMTIMELKAVCKYIGLKCNEMKKY